MTFRNSTMLMKVFLYGMTNESNLFSYVFFSENSSKELNILFSRKFAVNMVTTNTFHFLEPP